MLMQCCSARELQKARNHQFGKFACIPIPSIHVFAKMLSSFQTKRYLSKYMHFNEFNLIVILVWYLELRKEIQGYSAHPLTDSRRVCFTVFYTPEIVSLFSCSMLFYDFETFLFFKNLFCGQTLLFNYRLAQLILQFQQLIKVHVSCYLYCRIGRRYMVCISTSLTFIANIAMPFSINVMMFSVCRFFDGFCGNCLYMASFIIG